MNKKIKLSVLVIVSACLCNITTFADTVDKTTSKSIVNSYSQKNTVVIDVPYGINIKSVTTDNGIVYSSSLDKTTGKLTVVVDGGEASSKYNPTKYSKLMSGTEVKDYVSSLPAYTFVSSDGYSGSIPFKNYSESSTSKQVTGTAKVVEDWYLRCDYVGVLSDNKSYDPTKPETLSNPSKIYSPTGTWSGPYLNTSTVTQSCSSNWSINGTSYGTISSAWYSDSSGYSGYGTSSETSVSQTNSSNVILMPTIQNGWRMPYLYQQSNHHYVSHSFSLSATAYKTVYEGYYEGYVYKSGYDDVYNYNISVVYEEDVLDLSSLYSKEWTNKDLTILISSNSYFLDYFVSYGLIKKDIPSSFTVSSNGTYFFSVYDYGHGRTKRMNSISLNIQNIDKEMPYGSFSPSSRKTWAGDMSVFFGPLDKGGSGVKHWRYCISTDEGKTYGSYSGYLTSGSNILLNKDGINKIKVEVTDVAGNIAYIESDSYYVDKNAPDLVFTPNGSTWINKQILATWNATDSGSLLSGYSYRIKTTNGKSFSYSDWSIKDISKTSYLFSEEGYYELEVDVSDNAGNSKIYTSKAFKIDTTPPSLTVVVDSYVKDIYREIPVTLSDVKDNLSGVKNIELSLFEDFSKKVDVLCDNSDSYRTFVPRYGLMQEQTLYVKVTDNAGNTSYYESVIYLDPLPPDVPTILEPLNDVLLVNSEMLNIKWDYSDPANLRLTKTDFIFKNKENNKIYIQTINGDTLKAKLDTVIPNGVYNLTIRVYNSKNKSTESEKSIQVRKNRFKKEGYLYTREICMPDKPIKYVKINLDSTEQFIVDFNNNIKSYADIYIVLPNENGEFNLLNSFNIIKYRPNSFDDAFRLPGNNINKLLVLIKMKSLDEEYSRITPWLDSISVSVK